MAKATATIGLHGHKLLGLLYRYGCLTVSQLQRLTGLSETVAKRQLYYLIDAGYVARSHDVAGWKQTSTGRPRTAYYLTLPNGAKAGAHELGIENDVLSLKHYRRVRLPGTTSHRLLANEYLLSVIEAGAIADETYCEACPEVPIFGSGTAKSDRTDSPYKFARIVPDGVFILNGRSYYLEVETKPYGRPELVSKLSDYGGRWRRLLSPNRGERKYHNPDANLEPVIILTPEAEAAKRLQKYLRERLPGAGDWRGAIDTIREASGGRADAPMLVLLAGYDEVQADPLQRVYRPLRKYPDALSDADGWRVSLQDAAAISARIPVPAKKEVA